MSVSKLHPVIAENFKLDGGACFGVVPKSVWSKQVEADENNMIPLTNRCMLIEAGNRLILIDTGMGDKQSAKFFSFYYLFGDDSLKKSLNKLGIEFNQITDVILTHLHFDHAGGAVKWAEDGETPELVFKNATYYCTKKQWDLAVKPNPREKASCFKENFMPLFETGHMEFIHEPGEFIDGVRLEIFDGHTKGQLIPVIKYKDRTIVYGADFIPSVTNVPTAYISGFDTDPLLAMEEKEAFLERALNNDYILFFEHDYYHECCNLKRTEKGIRPNETFKLSDI